MAQHVAQKDQVRPSSYARKPNYEPANCSLLKTVQPSGDPYEEAEDYIKEHPERNCCTVENDGKVKQWQLPPLAKVQLRPKNGPTFYYDVILNVPAMN